MNPIVQTLIICFAVAAPLLLIAGAWAYQIFALKRELDHVETRLAERITRVETDVRALQTTLQNFSRDVERVLGKLDERTGPPAK